MRSGADITARGQKESQLGPSRTSAPRLNLARWRRDLIGSNGGAHPRPLRHHSGVPRTAHAVADTVKAPGGNCAEHRARKSARASGGSRAINAPTEPTPSRNGSHHSSNPPNRTSTATVPTSVVRMPACANNSARWPFVVRPVTTRLRSLDRSLGLRPRTRLAVRARFDRGPIHTRRPRPRRASPGPSLVDPRLGRP